MNNAELLKHETFKNKMKMTPLLISKIEKVLIFLALWCNGTKTDVLSLSYLPTKFQINCTSNRAVNSKF